MAIRNEVRIFKSNTLEELRQKSNELSIRNVGDDNLLSTHLGDKKESFTASAGQKFFELTGRFEVLPEQTIDKTTGVAEAYRVGAVRVTKDGTALTQGLASANFKVPNYSLKVTLTGSPSIPSEFVENAVLTQSGGFSGTLLSADSTTLRFKSFTGTFNTGQNLGIPHTDASKRVVASNISAKTDVDIAHGILIELISGASNGDVIVVDSTSLVDAVNELQDDVGVVENLATGSKILTNALNEHETDLYGTGNASFAGLSSTGFQDAIEEVRAELGAHTSLGTDHTATAVGAINELETAIRGTGGNYTLGTTSQTLVGGVNELEFVLRGANSNYTLNTAAANVRDAINEHESDIGTVGSLTTTGTNLVSAVNELDAEIGGANINSIASGNNTITGALVQLHTELGSATLQTSANTHTGAINEHESDIGNMSLNTGASNLTAAINELEADLFNAEGGDKRTLSDLLTADKTSIVDSLNEVHNDALASVKLTSGSEQTINSDVKFASGKTLDLRGAELKVSEAGGTAVFGSAFLSLDSTLPQMGLEVKRDHITPSGSMTDHDVQLFWDESVVTGSGAKPHRAWRVIGMEDDGSTDTADLVTFYNAEDLIKNNNEAGINVTWDSTNQNFDFNVNDPTITLTGDVTGSATMTNLNNVSIAATIAANSVALGTDTTGNYISTIAGTSNEIVVSGSGSETAAVTISLPDDVTIGRDLSVTRDLTVTRNLQVNGNTTLGNASSDTVSIPGNLTITGDLTVNGNQTSLNVSTLEVEDTLILTGTSSTEPTTGGFGIETKSFTGVGTHSNAASNVTGSHSLVYNFATDRWEADGSLVLSEATLGVPKIENTDFGQGKDLVFSAGSGLSETVTGLSGNTYTVTYTNTDKGSSQNIFKTIAADSGGSAVANSNTDTLTLAGGDGLNTVRSGDTITIHHDNTSNQSSITASANTFINAVTLDEFGHVQGLTTNTVDTYDGWALTVGGSDKGTITENERVSFEAGSGLSVGYSATNNVVTFSHANTSDVSDISASGTTFVQDMTFDNFGHVLTASTGNFTLGDGVLTIATAGGGLSGGGTFSANQTANATRTITLNSDTASSNNTIVQRTANGDIVADLFKTDNANNISSGSITKLYAESGDDGFIRYANAAAVRNFLNVANGATNTTNPNNATITLSAGTNLSGGGNFTTDQSSNETITFNMETGGIGAGTYGSTADGTKIDEITVDAFGRVTALTTGPISSNAATATALQNPRLIGGVSFNGTANINLPGVNTAGNQNTSGNAATATALQNARTIHGVSFDGTSNIDLTEVVQDTVGAMFSGNTETRITAEYKDADGTIDLVAADQSYTLPVATSGALGGIKIGFTESGRNYPVELSSEKAFVNVPWTDTLFTAGSGLNLSSTEFSLSSNLAGLVDRIGGDGPTNYLDLSSGAQFDVVFDSVVDFRFVDGGTFHADGDVVAFSTTTASDKKLKENIQKVNNALELVSKLDGVTFDWKDKDRGAGAGVIAQNVEEVLPSAVNEVDSINDKESHKVVDYNQLSALFIEAIKELKEENKLLKAEIEGLKDINKKV